MLLPPSERKAAGGDRARTSGAFAALEPSRAEVGKALFRSDFDASTQLGVGADATERAMAANRLADHAAALPALQRYTGVLYDTLAYPQQPVMVRRRLDEAVVVVSGRWGLLRGDDPVPPYKLPIGAVLPGLGGLARWWRPRLSRVLAEHVRGAVVWNLLPGAYAAAVDALGTASAVWTVRIVREADGVRSVVGHDNKAVKGALARALVADHVLQPGGLAGWTGPAGYQVAGVDEHRVELLTRR